MSELSIKEELPPAAVKQANSSQMAATVQNTFSRLGNTSVSATFDRLPMVHCSKLVMPQAGQFKTDIVMREKTDDASKKTCLEEMMLMYSDSQTTDRTDHKVNADDPQMLVPDSTTNQLEGKPTFNCGDDVFVKHKDGRYYLGTVIMADTENERWLVRFGDETERWASGSELRPLTAPGSEDAPAMCVVCKLRGGEILACDKCGRGYHRTCHSPAPQSRIQGASWQCQRCVQQRYKTAALENKASRREMLKTKKILRPPDTLPYDMTTLHWDPHHRTNSERTYCYCGDEGDWFSQMLQCARCRQWFHQKCLSCLKFPLYTGDRFYMFVCSLCNYGKEFIRRLELKWVDLVHLMLFNLTAYNCKKYYDLDTIIIPYIMDNWHALQLPQKMQIATPADRREYILSALTNHRNRFKCGKEIKKRANIWGLRARAPPPPPSSPSSLTPRGPLTENALAARWATTGRIAFIPEPDSPSSQQTNRRMVVSADSEWLSLMMGKRFQTSSNSSDNESLGSVSPSEMAPGPSYGFKANCLSDFNRSSSPYCFREDVALESEQAVSQAPPPKRKELRLYEMDYQGGGFVKKSVPFPELTDRKKSSDSLKLRCKKRKANPEDDEKFARTKKLLRNTLSKRQKAETVKSVSSKSTNTPSARDGEAFVLLDRNIPKDMNSAYQVTMKADEILLPPTPPTPPTPPSGITSSASSDAIPQFHLSQPLPSACYDSDRSESKILSENSSAVCDRLLQVKLLPLKNDRLLPCKTAAAADPRPVKLAAINLEISKLSTKNIIEHSKIMSLRHENSVDAYSTLTRNQERDSSGDDSSSRGTLDSIIPPPIDFRGRNNPFHMQTDRGSSGHVNLTKSLSAKGDNARKSDAFSKGITQPINGTVAPPARLLKRQLSEKDLVIGPDGEVKRRRYRRPRKATQYPLTTSSISERQRSLRSSLGLEEIPKSDVTSIVDGQPSSNGSGDNVQNGRCLRQRQEKNYSDGRRGSTSSNNAGSNFQILNGSHNSSPNSALNWSGPRSLNLSPQKMSPFKNGNGTGETAEADAMKDLKTTVRSYFGAANRIRSGEIFTVLARRITDSGCLQYLIDWETHAS